MNDCEVSRKQSRDRLCTLHTRAGQTRRDRRGQSLNARLTSVARDRNKMPPRPHNWGVAARLPSRRIAIGSKSSLQLAYRCPGRHLGRVPHQPSSFLEKFSLQLITNGDSRHSGPEGREGRKYPDPSQSRVPESGKSATATSDRGIAQTSQAEELRTWSLLWVTPRYLQVQYHHRNSLRAPSRGAR